MYNSLAEIASSTVSRWQYVDGDHLTRLAMLSYKFASQETLGSTELRPRFTEKPLGGDDLVEMEGNIIPDTASMLSESS